MLDILAAIKALADDTRLRLVHLLAHHELNVGELLEILGMGQSRVSRHLKILADAGLCVPRRDGAWVFYTLARRGEAARILDALRPALETLPQARDDLAAAARVLQSRSQASRRFFDRVAPQWESLTREALGGLDLPALVLERLPDCQVVADLGCGAGALVARLLEKARCVIGVDSSPRMLSQALRRVSPYVGAAGNITGSEAGERVSLRLGDLEHLPLSDGEAGCAVLSLVLHHLPSPSRGIREARRVLAPGGRCVVLEFARHEDETMRRRHGDRWLGFEAEELAGWLDAAGFRVVETSRLPLPGGLHLLCITAETPSL